MSKIKICGLLPFNDIFVDCKHNAIFPIVIYYNRYLSIFFSDMTFFYKYNFNNRITSFTCIIKEKYKRKTLLKKNGILENSKKVSKNIISDIKEALNENHPVIIKIDLYYQSFSKSKYHIEHWPHHLLIFGYDDDAKVFNAIEHSRDGNKNYINKDITYCEVYNSYYGYVENYLKSGKDPTPTFRYYNVSVFNEETYKKNCMDIFLTNIKENKNKIVKSIKYLDTFINDLNNILTNPIKLNKNINEIINILNNIYTSKCIQKYKVNLLLGENSIFSEYLLNEIELWNNVRLLLVKYMYSHKYKLSSINPIIDKLNKIIVIEKNYNEKLFDYISSVIV